jgi:fatty-acyl-CoA synthase
VPHFVTMIGGRHVMLRRFDPVALMQAVERHGVTRLLAVPAIFNAVLNHSERARFDLSSLRQVIIGGSPASPALVSALQAALGVDVICGYGLSETTPIVTLAQPRAFLGAVEAPEEAARRRAMTGWPIPGVTLRVADANGADVRADGDQLGEILVRGNTVMDGYYRDPDATSVTIRDGWLHTGDMAVIDEAGYVLIKDRAKDVIIRGGENISSVDVENAIASHPAVLECAVVAAPDERFGEAPVAFVVAKPGMALTTAELRAHCREHLARFKVPREFILREELPKGGTGKILKAELREPLWTGLEARVH